MVRQNRKVIAVNIETGERKEFASVYELAKLIGTSTQNVTQTILRNSCYKGWKLYDSPETLRARISDLKRQLAELEA